MLQTAGEIEPSKTISTDGKLTIFKKTPGKGQLQLLEDGKLKSYDIDPYIAESLSNDKIGDLNVIVSLIEKFNTELFKPLVTTYNLGFALAFNPKRDFERNYKLITGSTIFDLLMAYYNSIPDAKKYSKGELTEFTKALVESKAISAPVNDYNFDATNDEYGRILERAGIATDDKSKNVLEKISKRTRNTILKPVSQLLEGIRYISNTLEIVSKIAGAKTRIKHGEVLGSKELAYNVRNYTGTPNFKVKGTHTKTTNALFVFSNIAKEGLKTDFKIATDPNTRNGYWWKTVKVDLLPKLIMFAAVAGLAGDELKKIFDNITEYDLTNYICIPIGKKKGKTVYIRIPHDESGRLISAILWKMLNFIKDKKVESLNDIFSIGAGQLPSISPAIEIPGKWIDYLSGKNPTNEHTGRNIVDDKSWKIGGGDALNKMVEWTLNKM
jgi:hypothetical protein